MAENPVWAQTTTLLPYTQHEPNFASYPAVLDRATDAFYQIMDNVDIQQTLTDLTDNSNILQTDLTNEAE